MATSRDTTQLLIDASAGDEQAVGELLDHVYEEMRRIAHRELQRRRPGHTLNTTALAHEAYLKLFDRERLAVTDRRTRNRPGYLPCWSSQDRSSRQQRGCG